MIAVGPGSRSLTGELIPMSVSVGDKIIYTKFGGTEVEHNGEEVMVLMEKDIIAIIED